MLIAFANWVFTEHQVQVQRSWARSIDQAVLERQLNREPKPEDAVRSAYLVFANAKLPYGMTVRTGSHGFIERELRFEADGNWLYSAVLNQKWVLWYFRKPALNGNLVDANATILQFPEAEANSRGEIKLRVRSTESAKLVLYWIGAR